MDLKKTITQVQEGAEAVKDIADTLPLAVASVTNNNKLTIAERLVAPTPKLFRFLRTLGIATASIGGVILAAPVALPLAIVSIGGYLVTAGAIATTISQLTVDHNPTK